MVIFKCVCVCLPVWLSDFPETHMHALSHTYISLESQRHKRFTELHTGSCSLVD